MLCYWKDWRISGRGVLAAHELVNSMKAVQAARTDADTLRAASSTTKLELQKTGYARSCDIRAASPVVSFLSIRGRSSLLRHFRRRHRRGRGGRRGLFFGSSQKNKASLVGFFCRPGYKKGSACGFPSPRQRRHPVRTSRSELR